MSKERVTIEEILCKIHDEKLRECVQEQLNELPEYFWLTAASSSGKYHPAYCLGDGGLARHTIAACTIALEMFTISGFTEEEQDIILAALILHDGYKHGIIDEGHTIHEHPSLMYEHLMNKYWYECDKKRRSKQMTEVADCIASHMGQWTTSKYSSTILPEPETVMQIFVHTCDYLASRKCIEVDCDLYNRKELS